VTFNLRRVWAVSTPMTLRVVYVTFGFLAVFTLIGTTLVARQRPPQPPRPAAGQPGPWDNDILVFHVDGGGRASRLATFERAGVSTVARMRDGRLIAAHQHFPADNDADFDKVAVHFSSDEGKSWDTARVIRLNGLPDGMRFPFDPTLVPLPDGRIRMYFTSNAFGPASIPAIYSAVSSNGLDYDVEPGRRFGIDGRPVIDCAVALHQGVFHLFAPDNGPMEPFVPGQPPRIGARANIGTGYHATSVDGLTFVRADDVKVSGQRTWLGGAHSDGAVITFVGTGQGIWTATSANGSDWKMGQTFSVQGADPGAVPAKDGGWIITATGPPRRR
jgi:hypothetical protein